MLSIKPKSNCLMTLAVICSMCYSSAPCLAVGDSSEDNGAKEVSAPNNTDSRLRTYANATLAAIRKHWIPPVNGENHPEIASFAIDNYGKLLWISINERSASGVYELSVIKAIVGSAPFPPLPTLSRAPLVLRIPFAGSDPPELMPEISENTTRPDKVDWSAPNPYLSGYGAGSHFPGWTSEQLEPNDVERLRRNAAKINEQLQRSWQKDRAVLGKSKNRSVRVLFVTNFEGSEYAPRVVLSSGNDAIDRAALKAVESLVGWREFGGRQGHQYIFLSDFSSTDVMTVFLRAGYSTRQIHRGFQ